MKSKPVVIVGSGLFGGLLAYRLSETRPELNFKLLDVGHMGTSLGSWSFLQNEIAPESQKWLAPFISYQWNEYEVAFENFDRNFSSRFCTILPGQFESIIRRTVIGKYQRIQGEINLEEVLNEANFIIDTRIPQFQKVKCAKKSFGAMVELFHPHGIRRPLILDARVRQKDLFRYLQYLPFDEHTIMVQDVRYSKNQEMDLAQREEELLEEVRKRWSIKDVLRCESALTSIPASIKVPSTQARVLDLSGVVNLISGEEFPDTVKLIDQLVNTSMRPGELREVIKRFHTEKSQRTFARMIRKMLYYSAHPAQRAHILQYLFGLPGPIVEKFISGKITLFDLGKAFIGNPPFPLMKAVPLKFSKAYKN